MRLTTIWLCSALLVGLVWRLVDLTKELQQEVNHLRQDISRYEAMRSECAPADEFILLEQGEPILQSPPADSSQNQSPAFSVRLGD